MERTSRPFASHTRVLDGLSQRERRLLAELEHELVTIRPGHLATEVAPIIRDLLRVNIAAIAVPTVESNGVMLKRVDAAGEVLARYIPDLIAGMRAGELSFAFTMRAPERVQQNRPVAFLGARWVKNNHLVETNRKLGLSRPAWESLQGQLLNLVELHDRYGIADHHQLRTLICDGALVLSYFNVMHEIALDSKQHRLYHAILEMLRCRAVLEHRLASADSYLAALETTLDALAGAAFITNRMGQVAHANHLGFAMLDRDPDLPSRLANSIAGLDEGFTARPIMTTGAPREYLVTARKATLVDAARAIAAELCLGGRATEVLAFVAAAEPTKLIAIRLGVAENTVEYHLTTLFRRLGVSSRAELQRLLADRLTR